GSSTAKPWWQATLAPFVDITPSRQNGPLTAAEKRNADDALQLELTLARAAIERGDRAGRAAAPPSPGGRPRWHRSWTSPRAARTAR
ncbi:hypothetical protein C7E13_21900, partial [Stenotrophomonas maltophilia]